MQVKVNEKLDIKCSWWIVLSIFILIGALDFYVIKEIFLLTNHPDLDSGVSTLMVRLSFIFSFLSEILAWIIVSVFYKIFLSIISDYEEKLKQQNCFLVVGYSTIFTLVGLVVIFVLVRTKMMGINSENIQNVIKFVRQVATLLSYLAIIIFTTWYEKLTRKQTIALSIVFAVMFIVPIFIRTAMSCFS